MVQSLLYLRLAGDIDNVPKWDGAHFSIGALAQYHA